MKRSKGFEGKRLLLFFARRGGTSASQSCDEPAVNVENEPEITDRSTNLDDLNAEDWLLNDRFKVVSDFLDSMPCNSRATKSERGTMISNSHSTSPRRSSINRTLLEKTEAENQGFTRQMAEMDHLQAQFLTEMRASYHVNTMSIPCQETTISANVTTNLSIDTMLENVIPAGTWKYSQYLCTLQPWVLLIHKPIYHADDNGLLESNPCTRDTKDELITSRPAFLSMKREKKKQKKKKKKKKKKKICFLFVARRLNNLKN